MPVFMLNEASGLILRPRAGRSLYLRGYHTHYPCHTAAGGQTAGAKGCLARFLLIFKPSSNEKKEWLNASHYMPIRKI